MTNIYNHLFREGFHNKLGSCLQQNTTYLCYENHFRDREKRNILQTAYNILKMWEI